jgi:hypothetical protein
MATCSRPGVPPVVSPWSMAIRSWGDSSLYSPAAPIDPLPECIGQLVRSGALQSLLDCREEFVGTLELAPSGLLFQVSNGKKPKPDFLVREKLINDFGTESCRGQLPVFVSPPEQAAADWGENVIDEGSRARCFSLWQSIECAEPPGVHMTVSIFLFQLMPSRSHVAGDSWGGSQCCSYSMAKSDQDSSKGTMKSEDLLPSQVRQLFRFQPECQEPVPDGCAASRSDQSRVDAPRIWRI